MPVFAVGRLGLEWRKGLGLAECPYVYRWMVEWEGLGSLRIHHFLSSDDPRALHDHPWWFVTIPFWGGYEDVGQNRTEIVGLGGGGRLLAYRPALHRHTVRLISNTVWTFLITGPETRQWGFWHKGRFRKRNKWFFEQGHHPCDK
jgi:hypothetical protein